MYSGGREGGRKERRERGEREGGRKEERKRGKLALMKD